MTTNFYNNLNLLQCLIGIVKYITFYNKITGFFVLNAKIEKNKNFITIIGHSLSISKCEHIKCYGI